VKRLNRYEWALKYTGDEGDLLDSFYNPALACALQYDRATGYFRAPVLQAAARGIEGLLANQGTMRLIVGCTLAPEEVDAIRKGEELRAALERQFRERPLEAPDDAARDALELLAWMVQHGILQIKVAIPCDAHRNPIATNGIFHEKAGVIRDAAGDRIAFNGSVNETPSGWIHNWESFNVFTSWSDAQRVAGEEDSFARLWANKAKRILTVDVPQAARDDLLRFLPANDKPARLTDDLPTAIVDTPVEVETPGPDARTVVWSYIAQAAGVEPGGERVGEATSAVEPWPHQISAFERMNAQEFPRLLIADEVGLGKTIQAGLVLRQMMLAGRIRRALILTPASVLKQWQLELREKFNLSWPVYDGSKFTWASGEALPEREPQVVSRSDWHKEPFVIASSHLMRRSERQKELCEDAEPWDLVILDEAHHARRSGAGGSNESPNRLLQLMRKLRTRTKGLVLLTATPMQVHPIEVWDLLDLLGLPQEWTEGAFQRFYELIEKPNPDIAQLNELAALYRAAEAAYGVAAVEEVQRMGGSSRLRSQKILNALRDRSEIPRRQLENDQREVARRLMKRWSPIGRLISRHTRDLLRQYYKAGKLKTPIADRSVHDCFIDLSSEERHVYEEVENYISSSYAAATPNRRSAVGFVMTIYRRRVASSFRALENTLRSRLARAPSGVHFPVSEDASDDESRGDVMDADEVAKLERETKEDRAAIERLLALVKTLPVDTKTGALISALRELEADGYSQTMVFTQYTATLDFLRDHLLKHGFDRLVCLSGRGGEAPAGAGRWQRISRDEIKRRFRDGTARVLLCTDAAAEGLNFQFCGALINYDMPWNPMRVEQRIGRIDRLGQQHAKVRIINLHYRDTVETDVYQALRNRIDLFESVVGRLQPILSKLSSRINEVVLEDPAAERQRARAEAVRKIEEEIEEYRQAGLDLDEYASFEFDQTGRPAPALDHEMLDVLIRRPDLLPPGVSAQPLSPREYSYSAPGLWKPVRVTTNPTLYEQHSDSMELWSPGSPLFPTPEVPLLPASTEQFKQTLATSPAPAPLAP